VQGLLTKYFVLNPLKQDIYGKASRKAILVYADVIAKENKKLAEDLRDWVGVIRKERMAEVPVKDDADAVEVTVFDSLKRVAEGRYAGGRKEFGITVLDEDPRDFITESIEEVIDLAWYVAARLEQLKRAEK